MQLKTTKIAPALKALLEGFIDYAGLFPPAKLPMDSALSNYQNYKKSEYSWMLRWFVIGSNEASSVPDELATDLAVLADAEQSRGATIESGKIIDSTRPVYCEVSPANLEQLDQVKNARCFAKIRTGGLKPEAIPSCGDVAAFILACAERRLAFKATAGLHHPIRAEYPLTYEPDSIRATMHGFLNVLLASAFAWNGEKDIQPILEETDASAFSFDERAHWRNKSLDVAQVHEARSHFIHSVGSCSFEEPVQDLKKLSLLP